MQRYAGKVLSFENCKGVLMTVSNYICPVVGGGGGKSRVRSPVISSYYIP